jgi:hypothetical protein
MVLSTTLSTSLECFKSSTEAVPRYNTNVTGVGVMPRAVQRCVPSPLALPWLSRCTRYSFLFWEGRLRHRCFFSFTTHDPEFSTSVVLPRHCHWKAVPSRTHLCDYWTPSQEVFISISVVERLCHFYPVPSLLQLQFWHGRRFRFYFNFNLAQSPPSLQSLPMSASCGFESTRTTTSEA